MIPLTVSAANAATNGLGSLAGTGGSSNALQILLLIGGLSLIPAILFTVTGFTRILIVLGFIRTGLGTPTAPPNQVLVGIALFLTLFVMHPTITQIEHKAYQPLVHHQITTVQAIHRGEEPLREFMFNQTRAQDISLFVSLAKVKKLPQTRAQVPTYVLIPAFIMSELKSALGVCLAQASVRLQGGQAVEG